MFFTTLLLAGTASATCMHNLKHFKRQDANGEEVPIGVFGYTGLLGPLNWAALAPENEACKSSNVQSPINLDDTIDIATEVPVIDIPEQEFEFENLGTTLEVIANGTTTFAGQEFRLKQFHFHTPSEHRIGEEYFPLEMHMVHEGVTDPSAIAVVDLLFDITSDPAEAFDLLTALAPNVEAIQTPGTKTKVEGLPFEALVEHVSNTPLFQYTGSLTTPPCAEGLTFLIPQTPLKVDVDSFNALKKVIKFNSRYTQNSLGADNLIVVAGAAGTNEQQSPDALADGSPVLGFNGTAGAGGLNATAIQTSARPTFSELAEEAQGSKTKAAHEAVVTKKAKEENKHVAVEAPKKIVTVTVKAQKVAEGHY